MHESLLVVKGSERPRLVALLLLVNEKQYCFHYACWSMSLFSVLHDLLVNVNVPLIFCNSIIVRLLFRVYGQLSVYGVLT